MQCIGRVIFWGGVTQNGRDMAAKVISLHEGDQSVAPKKSETMKKRTRNHRHTYFINTPYSGVLVNPQSMNPAHNASKQHALHFPGKESSALSAALLQARICYGCDDAETQHEDVTVSEN